MTDSLIPSRRHRDRWADAVCRRDEYQQWAREHRGSMWDYQLDDGEEILPRRARLAEARRLCSTCPLQLACLAYHDVVVRETGERVAGVWGGVVFSNRESRAVPGKRRGRPRKVPVAA